MLIVLNAEVTEQEVQAVVDAVRSYGWDPKPMPGALRTAICVLGNKGPVDPDLFASLPGVVQCIPVTKPYKLVSRETGLLIVTEATDNENLSAVEKYADIVQIGARNMQNYSLLRLAGQLSKPVLLKRGFAATIDEWLMAAEYIMSEGNHRVILCERGIRTFSDNTRNTLDLSAIPSIKEASHLPIIVDPSHAAGRRDYVIPLSRGAIAVGADGLIIEVHHDPARALSDGAQSLYPQQFEQLMQELKRLKQYL